MDPHLSSIAALAWCRELGLDDDALTRPGHVVKVDDTAAELQILGVGDTLAVIGPESAVRRVPPGPVETPVLRAAVGGFAAHTEILTLCADWVDATRVPDPLISHDPTDLADLWRRCPPDDVEEAAPVTTEPDHPFVLLDDDHRALSAAGYGELGSLLADVRVLTAPEYRRRGLAATVTTLCTHDALDAGLIPMARIRHDNIAGRRLAAVSGYGEWGIHITVRLPAP